MRCFVAIDLPDPLRQSLEDLQAHLSTGRPVPAENLHLTLAFLGDVSEAEVSDLHTDLCALTARDLTTGVEGLDMFGALPRPRLIAANCRNTTALSGLHGRVTRAVRLAGIDLDYRRFRPHVTLARFSRHWPADPVALSRFLSAFAGFSTPDVPATRLGLYQSHLQPQGAVYDLLAGYDLVPPGADSA